MAQVFGDRIPGPAHLVKACPWIVLEAGCTSFFASKRAARRYTKSLGRTGCYGTTPMRYTWQQAQAEIAHGNNRYFCLQGRMLKHCGLTGALASITYR